MSSDNEKRACLNSQRRGEGLGIPTCKETSHVTLFYHGYFTTGELHFCNCFPTKGSLDQVSICMLKPECIWFNHVKNKWMRMNAECADLPPLLSVKNSPSLPKH